MSEDDDLLEREWLKQELYRPIKEAHFLIWEKHFWEALEVIQDDLRLNKRDRRNQRRRLKSRINKAKESLKESE